MLIGLVTPLIVDLPPVLQLFSIPLLSLGLERNNKLLSLGLLLKLNICLLPPLPQISTGFVNYFMIYMYIYLKLQSCGVTTQIRFLLPAILFFMPEQNTLRLIIILFEKRLFARIQLFGLFFPKIKWPIYSPKLSLIKLSPFVMINS